MTSWKLKKPDVKQLPFKGEVKDAVNLFYEKDIHEVILKTISLRDMRYFYVG